jgi:hypothetical protein
MAKKMTVNTYAAKKVSRKGRHSKTHSGRKRSNRGQGYPR